MEGFEGTNSIVKGLVSSGLSQVISLVQKLLGQVHPGPDDFPTSKGQFPSWIKPRDQKFLQASQITADVVVAADGTGDFTTVTDAVLAAPDYSMRRFVIFIKRGVYNEYVEIKKKKWNLMMIGEGMDVTVISGNRNFIDGWTTFRSATFGKNFHITNCQTSLSLSFSVFFLYGFLYLLPNKKSFKSDKLSLTESSIQGLILDSFRMKLSRSYLWNPFGVCEWK